MNYYIHILRRRRFLFWHEFSTLWSESKDAPTRPRGWKLCNKAPLVIKSSSEGSIHKWDKGGPWEPKEQ